MGDVGGKVKEHWLGWFGLVIFARVRKTWSGLFWDCEWRVDGAGVNHVDLGAGGEGGYGHMRGRWDLGVVDKRAWKATIPRPDPATKRIKVWFVVSAIWHGLSKLPPVCSCWSLSVLIVMNDTCGHFRRYSIAIVRQKCGLRRRNKNWHLLVSICGSFQPVVIARMLSVFKRVTGVCIRWFILVWCQVNGGSFGS